MKRPYEAAAGVIDKSQAMPVVSDELQVPTEAQHRRLIIRIFIACISTAVTVFVVFGGIVLTLFLKGYDSKKVVEVSTAVFQVISMSGAVGFFIPLGLASIVTLFIGIRMSRKSVAVLDKLDSAVESRLDRVDHLLLKTETMYQNVEKGEIPVPLRKVVDDVKRFVKEELKALRDDIRGARADAESELSDALDEGELEAAAAAQGKLEDGPPCEKCEMPTKRSVADHAIEYVCPNPECF